MRCKARIGLSLTRFAFSQTATLGQKRTKEKSPPGEDFDVEIQFLALALYVTKKKNPFGSFPVVCNYLCINLVVTFRLSRSATSRIHLYLLFSHKIYKQLATREDKSVVRWRLVCFM